MNHSEVFNQKRMDRCASIQRSIMSAWQRTTQFAYTVRATDSINNLTLDDLRTHYFAVGIADQITEIPFHDMLVVFSMIEQEIAGLKAHQANANTSDTEFTISYQISTAFSDEEAARLLSQIHIETPFDKGKRLRVVAGASPPEPEAGNQQT